MPKGALAPGNVLPLSWVPTKGLTSEVRVVAADAAGAGPAPTAGAASASAAAVATSGVDLGRRRGMTCS